MDWQDEGIVLSTRAYGEDALLLHLLTRTQGRHAGIVRGGQSRRVRNLYEPGNRLSVTWRARLAEQLGNYVCEPSGGAGAALLLDQPGPLAALASVLALAERALPEREPHGAVYDGLLALIAALGEEHWGEATVVWELALLRDLGFGLDLSACAATGRNDQLAYVSPKSGRAISLSAGEAWRERLLPLPAFLVGGEGGGEAAIREGLRLTGFFLERDVFGPHHQPLPPARERLYARFAGLAARAPSPTAEPQ
jgi:DNA repair protein RecO (recombination protein O)